jgi:hypothetical protein
LQATDLAMLKLLLRTTKFVFIGALLVSCFAMIGCIEASFQLASESRLPRWITVPPELTRADVSVRMDYHTPDGQGRSAVFIAKDKNGRILTKVTGKLRGLYPIFLNGPLKANHRMQYPIYEVITVNGITEIIEHRKAEPIFYVTDDPDVRKELLGDDRTE